MDKRNLEREIEMTRQRMIRSGIENGLQSAKTIRISKQLDLILNEYKQYEYFSKKL